MDLLCKPQRKYKKVQSNLDFQNLLVKKPGSESRIWKYRLFTFRYHAF